MKEDISMNEKESHNLLKKSQPNTQGTAEKLDDGATKPLEKPEGASKVTTARNSAVKPDVLLSTKARDSTKAGPFRGFLDHLQQQENAKPNTSSRPAQSTTGNAPPVPAMVGPINWLEDKDMLPCILPASRTIGFGFDLRSIAAIDFDSLASDLLNALLKERDIDSSRRPLVFIGHGYGTVIIQRLLSKKCQESAAGLSLISSTAAVILFAPPFRGSDELINYTMKSSKLPDSMRQIFTGSLRNGSPSLQNYWKEFRPIAQDRNIFVFVYLPKSASQAEKSYKKTREIKQSLSKI
jgi:hypothetical protein